MMTAKNNQMARLFHTGDLVVCTDTDECDVSITMGKTYEVHRTTILPTGLDEYGHFVEVTDDEGKKQLCYSYRFTYRTDYLHKERERRLSELGI